MWPNLCFCRKVKNEKIDRNEVIKQTINKVYINKIKIMRLAFCLGEALAGLSWGDY